MRVKVAPSELNIDPVLVAGDSIERVLALQGMSDKPSTLWRQGVHLKQGMVWRCSTIQNVS